MRTMRTTDMRQIIWYRLTVVRRLSEEVKGAHLTSANLPRNFPLEPKQRPRDVVNFHPGYQVTSEPKEETLMSDRWSTDPSHVSEALERRNMRKSHNIVILISNVERTQGKLPFWQQHNVIRIILIHFHVEELPVYAATQEKRLPMPILCRSNTWIPFVPAA